MFHPNETVFILGAGASWHYGYPTGEVLTKKVASAAEALKACLANRLARSQASARMPKLVTRHLPNPPTRGTLDINSAWRRAMDEAETLADRLRTVDPLIIDFFLGQNPSLADLGKCLIALVLLDCEASDASSNGNPNRREMLLQSPFLQDKQRAEGIDLKKFNDNWCRFIIHKLLSNCNDASEFLDNKVTFITFNYDVSLERQIYRGLKSIQLLDGSDVVGQFCSDSRFIHIYGKIRENAYERPPQFSMQPLLKEWRKDADGSDYWAEVSGLLDQAYEAGQGIKTMAPGKLVLSDEIERARSAIDRAACVYILGYGFDPANNELLDLPNLLNLDKNKRTILFTNFSDCYSVNKRASRVFFGRPDILMQRDVVDGTADLGVPICEKSKSDVYQALSSDFDNVEEHLLPMTII